MKKTVGIACGVVTAAMLGGVAYIIMDKKRRDKAEKMICNALDEANDMITRKMN